MTMLDIIRKKREGLALTREEIASFVASYMRGEVPDHQAAPLPPRPARQSFGVS